MAFQSVSANYRLNYDAGLLLRMSSKLNYAHHLDNSATTAEFSFFGFCFP